jgi:hypothetical protein
VPVIDVSILAHACGFMRLDNGITTYETGEGGWTWNTRAQSMCDPSCSAAIIIIYKDSHYNFDCSTIIVASTSTRLLSRKLSKRKRNAQSCLSAKKTTKTGKIEKRKDSPYRTTLPGTLQHEPGNA